MEYNAIRCDAMRYDAVKQSKARIPSLHDVGRPVLAERNAEKHVMSRHGVVPWNGFVRGIRSVRVGEEQPGCDDGTEQQRLFLHSLTDSAGKHDTNHHWIWWNSK